MTKPRLIYFDAPASRGEECRMALHLAGVEFEDVRVKQDAWPAMKPLTPYGTMPVFEVPGQPPLGQSNAILVLIGRLHGLHPADVYEAARHEAMMQYVEELRGVMAPTLRMGAAEKQVAREAIVANYLPAWSRHAESNIKHAPFFGGSTLQVVDLKLHMIVRWFNTGKVDHIPATIFDGCPKLTGVHDAVRDHDGVKAWNAKQ